MLQIVIRSSDEECTPVTKTSLEIVGDTDQDTFWHTIQGALNGALL